jgi:hypothetical protein
VLVAWLIGCTTPQTQPSVDASAAPSASVAPSASTPVVVAVDAAAESAAPRDAGADVQAMSERAMGMIEHVAKLITANKNDCAALGQRLEDYYEENDAFIVEAKRVYGTMPGADRKVIQKSFRQRFDTAWTTLQPTVKKCKDDPKVKDVLDKVF